MAGKWGFKLKLFIFTVLCIGGWAYSSGAEYLPGVCEVLRAIFSAERRTQNMQTRVEAANTSMWEAEAGGS